MNNRNMALDSFVISIAKYAVLVVIVLFVYNVFSQTYADSDMTAKQLETEVLEADKDGLKGAR